MARVRFRPPPIEPTTDLVWLLRAAFSEPFPEALDIDQSCARDLANRLGLAAVIGARLRVNADAVGLSEALAEDFRRAHARSAVRAAMHERTARRIAEIAARRSTPLVFLKGFALFLSGRDRAGGRTIGDLDLLAPEEAAKSLHAELLGHGFEAESKVGNEHHLATLVAPEGGNVDLHFCIRGLSFEGSKSWATWDDLNKREALMPAEGFPDDCALPVLDVQAAHLLAHGLAHHVWRPHTYPLLQLVGDMQELLPDDGAWQDFLNRFRPILLRAVNEPELDALRALALQLKAGHMPDLAARPPEDTAVLLKHILAGYLDESYGRRLRSRHSLGRLGDAARQGRLWHYLARKAGLERID